MTTRENERRDKLTKLFNEYWFFRFRDLSSSRCISWPTSVSSYNVKHYMNIIKADKYNMFVAKISKQSDIEFYNLKQFNVDQSELVEKLAEGLQEKYTKDTEEFYKTLEEIYEDLQEDIINE